MKTKKTKGTTGEVARRFCEVLAEWLTPAQLEEVRKLNRAETDPNICHFCVGFRLESVLAMEQALNDCGWKRAPNAERLTVAGDAWDAAKASSFDPLRAGKKSLAYCRVCGSTNVQITSWTYANTGKDAGGDSPTEGSWCDECDEETPLDYDDVEADVFERALKDGRYRP